MAEYPVGQVVINNKDIMLLLMVGMVVVDFLNEIRPILKNAVERTAEEEISFQSKHFTEEEIEILVDSLARFVTAQMMANISDFFNVVARLDENNSGFENLQKEGVIH